MTPDERFEQNLKLAPYTLYHKLHNAFDEDLLQIAYIGLWKACKTFNETNKIAFSTYATFVIANEIKQEYRHRMRIKETRHTSLEEPVSLNFEEITLKDTLVAPEAHDLILKDGIERAYQTLTPVQKRIFRLLDEGYKQIEIAFILKVTKQYISAQIAVIREKFKHLL